MATTFPKNLFIIAKERVFPFFFFPLFFPQYIYIYIYEIFDEKIQKCDEGGESKEQTNRLIVDS